MPNSIRNTSHQAVDKFVVRLPRSLKEEITAFSRRYHRSMNSEIVIRLEESIAAEQANARNQVKNQINEASPVSDKEIFKEELSPFETRLIIFYRRLSEKKRQALLSLFAN
ncbi:MAG: Arc family DNA-binding protein [Gammaproteobacteria bacterium]|nr:Arc family DNA-binding protein [Gammaproteobacteria bacterium]